MVHFGAEISTDLKCRCMIVRRFPQGGKRLCHVIDMANRKTSTLGKAFPFKNDCIIASIEDGIAHVALARGSGNPFSLRMLKDLSLIGQELAYEKTVRAVVLTSKGSDFCTGLDLRDPELIRLIDESDDCRIEFATLGETLIQRWSTMPVPVIISAKGNVSGPGACLFTIADFRFTSATTRVSFSDVDRGMHLAWGILPRMVHEFGMANTKLLGLAGIAFSSGDFAKGVCREEENADQAARLWARFLAQKPPLAVRSILSVLRDYVGKSEPANHGDREKFAKTVGSQDFVEAMSAWLEKRPGRYHGR